MFDIPELGWSWSARLLAIHGWRYSVKHRAWCHPTNGPQPEPWSAFIAENPDVERVLIPELQKQGIALGYEYLRLRFEDNG